MDRTKLLVAVSLVTLIVAFSAVAAGFAYQASTQNSDNIVQSEYALLQVQDRDGTIVDASEIVSDVGEAKTGGVWNDMSAQELYLVYQDTLEFDAGRAESIIAMTIDISMPETYLGSGIKMELGGSEVQDVISQRNADYGCGLLLTFSTRSIVSEKIGTYFKAPIKVSVMPESDISADESNSSAVILTANHTDLSSTASLELGGNPAYSESDGKHIWSDRITYKETVSTGATSAVAEISGSITGTVPEGTKVAISLKGDYDYNISADVTDNRFDMILPMPLHKGAFVSDVEIILWNETESLPPVTLTLDFDTYEVTL